MQRIRNHILVSLITFIMLISFGLTTTLAHKQNNRIKLTKEEMAFLKAHPVIKFGTDETWAPYVIQNPDGTLEGFDIDMLKYINEATGSNIQLIIGQWHNMIQEAKTHKIDGLTTSAALDERAPFFNFSNTYISNFPLVIVKMDNPIQIDKLEDLSGKTVAIQKGNASHKALLQGYPKIKVIEYNTQIKAISMLIEGKIDAALANTATYNTIQKKFLNTVKIIHILNKKPLNIVYSIRKDWPELQSIINKALSSLPYKTKNDIYSHWFGFNIEDLHIIKSEKRIDLTDAEKAWIKKHPVIRLGVDPAFHPIEFIDHKGQYQGIASNYVQILNKRLGLNMKIFSNMSWKNVIKVAPSRGVDVLPAVAKTDELEKYLSYSKPYIYVDWVIVSRMDTPRIKDISELKGRTITVNNSYPIQSRIEHEYPRITLLPKDRTVDALQSVINREADAAVLERYSATTVIQSYRMHSLQIDTHVFQQNDPIGFAVRSDWPELVQLLNKGLASINRDERHSIKQKWMAVPILIGYTIKNVIIIVISIVIVMSIFLLAFHRWNRKLQKEVAVRVKTEQALEKINSLMKIGESIAGLGFFERNWQTGNEVWSDGLCQLLGIENQETYASKNFMEFIHKDDKQRVHEHIQEMLLAKTSMDAEFKLIQKDGKIINIHGIGLNSYDKEGNSLTTRGTFQDISERKRANETLKKCFDTTACSIGISSIQDGTFLYFNNRFPEMLGWEPNEMLKKNSQELGIFHNKNLRAKLAAKLKENTMIRDEEMVFEHKSGRLIHGLLSATIIDSERLAFSIYDITERKEVEITRLKLEQQIQQSQKLESIGTLAGGIAHDFNNMLGVVFGNISYLLTKFNDNKELVEVLSNVMEQSKNAQNLTQQLLTFSKGGAPIKKVTDINSLIQKAAKFVTSGAKAKCEFELSEHLWITEVDPGQINQVISNIIINANQAMPEGGIIKVITENDELESKNLMALPQGRYIKIVIKDQGIGISEKDLLKIFDPYFSTKLTSSGLGLATAFSIIKKHSGHISVHSKIGKGTNVYIYLPVSSKDLKIAKEIKKTKHTGEGKILVMDDEKQILAMSSRMLSRMGYKTEGAKDGDEAIKKYQEALEANNSFDLVILDLTIPGGMGGAETIKELLRINPEVKAIVSSGYSNDPIMANYKDYDFCGILPKPYSLSQLAEVLNNVISNTD